MGRTVVDLADHLLTEDLQGVQDAVAQGLGTPVLFVDPSGRPLAVCEDLSEFCRWFTRAIPLSRPCLDCGRSAHLAGRAAPAPSLRATWPAHTCPLGVNDIAIPIWSAGDIIGYLVTAQVCLSDPERAHLPPAPKPAEAEEHLALLSRLRRVSGQELARAAAALTVVAHLAGTLAASRRRNLRLAERIREQSRWIQANERTDAVTRLANRRHFLSSLDAELARVRRYQRTCSLAVLDILAFRQTNEEFGHEVGDAVLRALAHTISTAIRQTDLAGRIGSDEFAVLFTETSRPGAMIALARLSRQIEDLNASGELPVEIRVVMGVVEYVPGEQELLNQAVEQLERAKQAVNLPR